MDYFKNSMAVKYRIFKKIIAAVVNMYFVLDFNFTHLSWRWRLSTMTSAMRWLNQTSRQGTERVRILFFLYRALSKSRSVGVKTQQLILIFG